VTASRWGETVPDQNPQGNAAGPYGEIGRILTELPRPRLVRMSRRGIIIAPVVAIALLASMGIYAATDVSMRHNAGMQNAGPSQLPVYAFSIAISAVFVIFLVSTLGKQKRLLAEGEIATAQVTKRWAARNGPNIRYEFTTPLGEKLTGSAADGSRKLFVGMNVPIFYDSQNPKKRLALCASFYEVILPGKE
jgi:hypothetical protein